MNLRKIAADMLDPDRLLADVEHQKEIRELRDTAATAVADLIRERLKHAAEAGILDAMRRSAELEVEALRCDNEALLDAAFECSCKHHDAT